MSVLRTITRRNFIKGTAGAGALLAMVETGLGNKLSGAEVSSPISLPLPCSDAGNPVIDPDKVREYAYYYYFEGGCMHGAASGLMHAFKKAFEDQQTGWDIIPYGMYKYGSGGVGGWGTLCGILNGTMAVLNLIGLNGVLGNEIMEYYSSTPFPTANCEGYSVKIGEKEFSAIPDHKVLAHTVSKSPLCHISIGKWCDAAGVSLKDASAEGMNYKQDRCSKICADTAAKAAELINEYLVNGSIQSEISKSQQVQDCLGCHTEIKDMVGKMDCMGCHSPGDATLVGRHHPRRKP